MFQEYCLATAPNIVFILTDDQAWNGTSVQMDPSVPGSKSDFYQTPRLEQLAAQGMRFSNAYSSAPVCSPTRAAVQTGTSPAQLQIADLVQALPPGSARWKGAYEGLPLVSPAPFEFDPNQLTMPRIIKQSNPNYVTSHIGKWHLDIPSSTTPLAVGYDFVSDPILPPDEVDPWGVFQLSNAAGLFMENRVAQQEPFFMQVSYRAVHEPIRSRQIIRDKYAALTPGTVHDSVSFAAMTEDLDSAYGMIMDKIDQLGIADNTYVIFASDNGSSPNFSSTAPLRPGKGLIWEGGIRVPFIVKGPDIQAGSVSYVPVSTTDIFSTVADLAGYSGPTPTNVEGTSLRPVLENDGQLPADTDHLTRNFTSGGELYWHWPMLRLKPSSAVRDGDYKLFVEWGESGTTDRLYLYNLTTDIGETVDLSSSMPAKTAELKSKLDNYLSAIDASFAFDVKKNVIMDWNASQPGSDAKGWRSTIDLKYKGRETWNLGSGSQEPSQQAATSYQPGLPKVAFRFDGNDVMRRLFFQVGDDGPRQVFPNVGTPDWNRSATMEFWVRLDSLAQNAVLMESGDGTGGISVSLGDADSDGLKNDLRFRVLGLVGADTGVGTLKGFSATAKIDNFADPTQDYVHLVAVFNDDPTNRYQEIYVNGALATRVDAALGADESPQWDTYDMAGLGGVGGNGLGGNGGTGDLPFSGGFHGEFAKVRFYNYAVTVSTVQSNYNSVLAPSNFGVTSLSGNVFSPTTRPVNLTLDMAESALVQVIQERMDILDSSLSVDAIINGGVILENAGQATPGQIPAGTKFNSYVLHFDPVGQNGLVSETAAGMVSFGGEILGILFNESSLVAADALIGSLGNYGASTTRGLTLGLEGMLGVSSDRHELSFDLSVLGNKQLQFRVLTTGLAEADFNGDGFVNMVDLSMWQASYGLDFSGDADGDGDSDGRDFLVWQRQATLSDSPASASDVVPEPTTCLLLINIAGFSVLVGRNFNRNCAFFML